MLKQMLGCCKVYISESRNKTALEAIERAAKQFPNAPIVNKFEDEIYNRVGYTLVSELGQNLNSIPLNDSVFQMVKTAFQEIDFESHSGTHPRLGVVDHICFHPLAGASLESVAGLAKSLADDVGSRLQVATFLYGAAHHEGKSLASIRRELGYFKPNKNGNQWTGGSTQLDHLRLTPDAGPTRDIPKKGVLVIGATRWVDNYNVPILSSDIAAVRAVAKRVSGKGGGLSSVQSMALSHGEGVIEVACNLLEPSEINGDRVQSEVERLGKEEGVEVGKGYYTDLSWEELIERYSKMVRNSDH